MSLTGNGNPIMDELYGDLMLHSSEPPPYAIDHDDMDALLIMWSSSLVAQVVVREPLVLKVTSN